MAAPSQPPSQPSGETVPSVVPVTGAEPAASPLPGVGVQAADSDRPQSSAVTRHKRKKQESRAALAMMVIGAIAFCIMGAVALYILTRPAERPVAKVPEEPQETEEPEFEYRPPRRSEWPEPDEESDFPTVEPETAQGDFHPIFEVGRAVEPQGELDETVFAKWEELEIEPANLCSDGVFLRRVYLDLTGTLPTVKEAKAFLDDESPDKRAKLIDKLLESDNYVDYWTMRWCDILRVKAEFPINLWPNAAQAYHRWVHQAIKTNMPYDEFVRQLLTSSGSNFRTGQVNFYRAVQTKDPRGVAQAVALTFMGTRADKWPEERLDGLAGFFTKVGYKRTGEWKEEIIIFDPDKDQSDAPKPVFPDGTAAELTRYQDPREVFADWLITPKNPWFARQIVNRMWYWLQGRGIVHEPDDIRAGNPPSNSELLNYLADELVEADYDLKHVMRLILNSTTYQLSSIPTSDHPEAAAQFASYTVRRLEAEVIIDALNQITGTTETYSSIIPEPYTFIPENCRAIALPDGSITSSFLELFGKPPRDSGYQSERNNNITAGQRLHLLNSSHVRDKIRKGEGIEKITSQGDSRESLYLAILSRRPGPGDGWGSSNLAWTLINTTEFLFRH
jgi:hypothetical protein